MSLSRPTRLHLSVLIVFLLLGTSVSAQTAPTRIYSRPEIPSTEALRRLNLRLGWRAYVPTEGRKDYLVRIAILGKDLLVLTRSGTVQRMDAETGKVYWRTRVGKPYTMLPFVSANSRSVYVIANAKLIGLERATGRRKWAFPLPSGISAGPVVDEEQIYIPFSDTTLSAYYLPFVSDTEKGGTGETELRSTVYGRTEEERNRDPGIGPRPVWSERTNIQLSLRPLQTEANIFVLSPKGQALGFAKFLREGESSTEIYSLNTEGRIRIPPTSFGAIAYIGSVDAALYAINMTTGKLQWRHTAGTAVTRSPAAIRKDVFVTSDRGGLARIDRESGDAMWRIPSGRTFSTSNALADRFLAANDRFVYATDHAGRLLVLDYKRGIRLSALDTRDFRFPVVNEVTDRVYLAANNGLIVCLHDRDVVDPIRHRRAIEDARSPLLQTLNGLITEPATREVSLNAALQALQKKYKLGYVVVERAFKEAGVPNILEIKVRPPRTENKPLRDHLQRLLKQVDAIYQIKGEVVLIVPAKPKP